jgi:hypothetical protein
MKMKFGFKRKPSFDDTYRELNRSATRVFSGVKASVPRIRKDINPSRSVLEDSYKLDTDITRRRQF